MKIQFAIHVSDIQVRKMARHEEFKKVFDNFFNHIEVIMKGKDAESFVFVVTGDVFQNKIDISNEQQMLVKDFFVRMAEITNVVIIAGNHDFLVNNKQRLDSLTPVVNSIGGELGKRVHYLKESSVYELGNLAFVNYSIFENNNKPEGLIEHIEMNKSKGFTYIGLFHAPLIGAVAQNNMVFETGESTEIFDGCDLVMAGDIHKYQVMKYKIPVVYAGSMVQQNVGESLSNHGFLLWDLNTKTHEMIEVENEHSMAKVVLNGFNNLETGLRITNE